MHLIVFGHGLCIDYYRLVCVLTLSLVSVEMASGGKEQEFSVLSVGSMRPDIGEVR